MCRTGAGALSFISLWCALDDSSISCSTVLYLSPLEGQDEPDSKRGGDGRRRGLALSAQTPSYTFFIKWATQLHYYFARSHLVLLFPNFYRVSLHLGRLHLLCFALSLTELEPVQGAASPTFITNLTLPCCFLYPSQPLRQIYLSHCQKFNAPGGQPPSGAAVRCINPCSVNC